jgi:elongation factor 1 alpha-like protein
LICAGYADAGKSTLMGHLLYLIGFVDKRAMHKYEQSTRKIGKASFTFAWLLDETKEERWGSLLKMVSPCG